MKKPSLLSLPALALLGTIAPALAAQSEAPAPDSGKTVAHEVRRDAADAADSIENYSAAQRDEAARNAKAGLDDLDARIHGLEARIDRNWDTMDHASRERARDTLAELRKQRIEAAEWYGGLKHSTVKAWGHVKEGFAKSYKSLKESWRKAEREYRDDGKN